VRPASEADPLLEDDPLLELADGDDERGHFTARWQEIQAGFVDEPGRAVQEADSLVVGPAYRPAWRAGSMI
jgi:hypothetical protein